MGRGRIVLGYDKLYKTGIEAPCMEMEKGTLFIEKEKGHLLRKRGGFPLRKEEVYR